jgi:hypothetical protein
MRLDARTLPRFVAIPALLLALAAPAHRAGAQETAPPSSDPRIAARFSGEHRQRLQAILDSARAGDIPTEPLVQRALEGASRRLPPERVVAAVSGLAGRLRTARAALGAGAGEADLLAAASALHAGIEPAMLERFARSRGGAGVALPLIVLVDIVERGVPQDTAQRVILSLSDPRVADADFQALRQSILQDIGSGAPAGVAAAARARGLLVTHGLAAPTP